MTSQIWTKKEIHYHNLHEMESQIVRTILLAVDREPSETCTMEDLFADYDDEAIEEGRAARMATSVLDQYVSLDYEDEFNVIVAAISSINKTESTLEPTVVIPRMYTEERGAKAVIKSVRKLLKETKAMLKQELVDQRQELYLDEDEDENEDVVQTKQYLQQIADMQDKYKAVPTTANYYKIISSGTSPCSDVIV